METARAIADVLLMLDFPLVLIQPHSAKLPLHKGWPSRELTHEDIEREFAANPNLGVGIKLGGPAGYIDVEGDGPTAELDWDILTVGVKVPNTVEWESERGTHRLFHMPPGYRERVGEGIIKIGDLEVRLGSADRYTHYSILPPAGGRSWKSQTSLSP